MSLLTWLTVTMIVDNQPCPACRANGHDRTGNHLMIFDDGAAYCNRAHHHANGQPYYDNSNAEVDNMGLSFSDVKNLSSNKLSSRGIDADVAQHYGVKVFYDTQTRAEEGYAYPLTSAGNVVGYRIRKLPKVFLNVSEKPLKGVKLELIGQSACNNGGKKLLITGGQDDMLAAFQMLYRSYPKFKPSVVSLPNGESSKAVADNIDFVNKYQEVIICTDMDEVGRKAARDIALLVGHKAKVMELSEKDANDMLLAGKDREFVNAFFEAKPLRPEGVVAGCDIKLEELRKPTLRGYATQYEGINSMIGGLRKGELVTLCAASGIGKSTLGKELIYHLRSKHDLTVGVIALEETITTTVQSMIALDNDVPSSTLRLNPDILTEEQWQNSFDKLIKTKFFALDHFGSMPVEDLMVRMRHFAYAEKCDFILLDHLSLVISGLDTNDERKMLDRAMTALAAFCTESGTGVISVVHLSRNKGKKSFNEGGAISLNDLRGSSGIEGLSWAVLGLERDQQDEEEKNISKVRVLKNRVLGNTGIAQHCIYDTVSGRLLPHKESF